jgi:prepilin-type N-terminal cleavage/methylation domain-containing protein
MRPDPPTGGYSLIELMAVLALLALVAGLARPAFGGYLDRIRMGIVLDRLTRDLSYARVIATRAGQRVELRFRPADSAACVAAYEVVLLTEPERLVREVDLATEAPTLCLRKNGPAVLGISSRGRPSWNASFWIRSGAAVDSLTLNQLGRVYRWK